MRSQPNTNPQESGEQKKSVFDRLGRQLDTSRSLNHRSPAQYGEHQLPPLPPPPLTPTHPMMHEAEFGGRYGRGDPNMPDMNAWRYQQDRRHMPYGRDRHPPPVGPPQPPLPHFDMDMQTGRQQPQYYPHPHAPQYHANQPMQPPGPPLPPQQHMGPSAMAMGMQQRRPSPKYDRHGNPIRGPMRMEPHLPLPAGMSPPGPYMGPPSIGPMMHPGNYDMPPMRPGMYPQNRWHDNLEMGPPMMGRLLPDERFMDQQRLQQQQHQQQHQQQQLAQAQRGQMMNLEMSGGGPLSNFEAPRYSKWRERRDVITNLDRQTAQSSSKTDSLKSSLQQPDTRSHSRKPNNQSEQNPKQALEEQSSNSKQTSTKKDNSKSATDKKSETAKSEDKPTVKTDPADISDGEIIDDEDSSDDSDEPKEISTKESMERLVAENPVTARVRGPYGRMGVANNVHYYDAKKRRRLHDRDDYPMDYETISDDELDDFMSHKKLVECGGKTGAQGSVDGKSSSEIELLNALGLDWANLIELSKQSRNEAPNSGSALRRFSMPNYLPTLGITRDLAGSEIYDLILRVCY